MRTQLTNDVIIGGKYQITTVLGENPVGITYAGVVVQNGQKVVIREFMPQDDCERADNYITVNGSDRFEQEKQKYSTNARILLTTQGLQAVAQVYELLEENGTVYTIMEYVEGISLEAYLTQNKNRFPVERMQVLLQPLFADFARLQDMGFVHGNISPDNLIFNNTGNLKLVGFGYIQGKVSPQGSAYAPVEMYQGQVNISADVYALCATIYRCVTGIVPPSAYQRLSQDTLQKPSTLGVAIAPGAENALIMGLNVQNMSRFQAMKAFQRAFGQVQETTTTVTKKVEKKQEVNKKENKKNNKTQKGGNGGTIALIVVGCVLVIGLGVSAFVLANQLFGKDSKSDLAEIGTEESTEETTETSTDNSDETSQYEQMLTEGKYDDVINQIVTLSNTTDLSAEQKDTLSQILKQAMDAQYSDFESKVAGSKNANDYDAAFSQITEEENLYNQLQSNSLASMYVDMQKIADKNTEMRKSHAEYLMNDVIYTAAANLNENGLNSALTQLQDYVNDGIITEDEYQKNRESAYTKYVIAKITSFNNAGTDAQTILQYINTNLANTGNNSQVLEFWDYYNALLGGNLMDTTIRHQSSSGYILEYSNSVNLTRSDIDYLSQYEVKLALYEIFARHGKIFSDSALNEYFQSFSWYQPSANFDDSVLNEYEKNNLDLLISYQRSMGYR